MPEFLSRVEGLSGAVPVQPPTTARPSQREQTQKASFAQVLEQQVRKAQEVRFSLHALERLRLRNIHLTQEEVETLGGAVSRIAEKGGRESLVVMDRVAFLVNVPSRTVITAIDQAHLRDSVFTQIDSAVIA
ncbi:MAG: flagellar protein [candidate division KSB1 bacterium]|nr:flagellar protein [candidate division KSB1 bacterium]MDZ7338294.1 flagellar protein [candidate division KSB1 bacterium]MDZ7377947.1 flagellar protein [candidate division KSB1 bacterium]MDZ7393380.1 flagellar protein [candidate division KSB1 bacterium]